MRGQRKKLYSFLVVLSLFPISTSVVWAAQQRNDYAIKQPMLAIGIGGASIMHGNNNSCSKNHSGLGLTDPLIEKTESTYNEDIPVGVTFEVILMYVVGS